MASRVFRGDFSCDPIRAKVRKDVNVGKFDRFPNLRTFFGVLQHWHYSEKGGLKNCNQIFRKNTLVMMWELCCEREGRQRRSTEA